MTLYVPLPEATAYIDTAIVGDSVEVEAALLTACEAVDRWCKRTFNVPTSATGPRPFTPPFGSSLLKVHDIASTTDLVIVEDGVTLAASAYQLEVTPGEPSQVTDTGESRPYAYIRLLDDWWEVDNDRATVSITARWGWPATPESVKTAVKMLTRDYFTARRSTFGVQSFGVDGFTRRISDNPMVQSLLADYRSIKAIGIA